MPIRWRLTLWHTGLLAVALVASAFLSYGFLAGGLLAETDRALRDRAEHVIDVVDANPEDGIQRVAMGTVDEFASPGLYVQVLDLAGRVVARSDNLGGQRLPTDDALLDQVLAGQLLYTTETVAGQRVRLYSQPLVCEGVVVGAVQVGQSLRHQEDALGRLRAVSVVGIVLVLALAGAGNWWLVRRGLEPVDRITRTAQLIERGGDLGQRLDYHGPQDELGRLAATFDEMLSRLEAAFATQRRFVADAAHELRTPLASMLGNVDLLLRYGHDAGRRAAALAAIKREGERTSRLVADLLLLAQADAGQQLERRPVELDAVLLEVYEQGRGLAEGVEVVLGELEPLSVAGDADRLKQVFLNLMDNALAHTPTGGRVTISLASDGSWARATVSDTGHGIPPKALPHIFERFYRGQDGGRQGTGLGLAIVKWIVDEHGGRVTVNSRVGEGSTFTVWLPLPPFENTEGQE